MLDGQSRWVRAHSPGDCLVRITTEIRRCSRLKSSSKPPSIVSLALRVFYYRFTFAVCDPARYWGHACFPTTLFWPRNFVAQPLGVSARELEGGENAKRVYVYPWITIKAARILS